MLVPVLNSFSSLAHTYSCSRGASALEGGSLFRLLVLSLLILLPGWVGGGKGGVGWGGDLTDSCRGFSFSPPTIVLMWTWVMYDPSTVSEPLSSLMTKVASSVLTLTLTLGPEKKQ